MELVGRIDYAENIKINPLELDFSIFSEPECAVCHTHHHRTMTYIIQQDDGSLIQVGKNCLDKILGYIPEHYNCSSSEMMDSIMFGFSGSQGSFETRKFLFSLIEYFKIKGFNKEISYSDIKQNKELVKHLTSIKNKDYSEVDTLINWYKNLEPSNSFMSNLKSLVTNKWFSLKYFNIIKYAYKVYNDEINYKPEYESKAVDYTETTIAQVQLVNTVMESYAYNQTTEQHIYRIIDVLGNVFQYKTSKENIVLKNGDKISYKLKQFKLGGTSYQNTFQSKKFGTVNKITYVKVI